MPNKRGRHRKNPAFFCPYCGNKLWRLGGEKYRVFYEGSENIKKHLLLSNKKAKLLAAKGAYIDQNSWIEEFFCRDDGKMWLLISKREDGSHEATLARSSHWKQATRAIDPNLPNPSVSEYTYRASRGLNTN